MRNIFSTIMYAHKEQKGGSCGVETQVGNGLKASPSKAVKVLFNTLTLYRTGNTGHISSVID